MDPADLTYYCLGIVTYTTCLGPNDRTANAADARAYNNSQTMPRYSNCTSCIVAQKELLCSLVFQKCNASSIGAIEALPMCRNTCDDFFTNCNVSQTTQCQYTSGIGPSDSCTGGPTN